MTTRTISNIETSTPEQVGEFKIKNVLPTRNLKQVDPFLLIHHMSPFSLPANQNTRIPPHPHAGFEVVTYLLQGSFFHRDSGGHETIGKAGDINWMTSGAGIVHSEGPAEELLRTGGLIELMQVWINLPAKDKQLVPSFRNYPSESFPVVSADNYWLKVLMGTYAGKPSPVVTQTPVFFFHLKLKAGQLFSLPVDMADSAALYVLSGKIKVLNETVIAGQLVNFHIDGDQIVFSALEDADLTLFGGTPIKEKVVSYGPFVMNSVEEIQQAISDYQSGKMGELEY